MTILQTSWIRSETIPSLDPGQIHVWALDLDVVPAQRDWDHLSQEETARARRFVFPRDRDRYVRAHAAARALLGAYTGIAAAEIHLIATAYGKPELACEQNARQVRFNLSHSAGIGIFAAARGYEIGVDVEMIRPIGQDIAEHHFSPRELKTMGSLAGADWLRGFFRCWTSKEALLKGEGMGLNLPLDAFDVEAHPDRPAALLDCREPARFASGWRLVELGPAPNAVGALAARADTGHSGAAEEIDPTVQLLVFNG
jgi:4'-phosphopantetheinyl transferase